MGETVFFTADLHGNKLQYEKLFSRAKAASAIIIGGDLTPKDPKNRTVALQKKFIEEYLIPRISRFKEENEDCEVFLIMGNDDFRENYDFLKNSEAGFVVLNQKPVKWKSFTMLGYPFVPYTPFIYKDWEKADLTDKKETDREDIILKGVKSTSNGLVPHIISLDDRTDSIERDMQTLFENVEPEKTILVIHTPPHGTNLDMMYDKRHVGSEAVKKMIREKQPLLTLHGHIHESVDESGSFVEKIGKTVSLASGNDHVGEQLAIIEIDVEKPEAARRVIL